MRSKGPTRILLLVESMHRAGLETWLMHILRRIDRERFHIDFMVQTTKKADYDDEVRDLGSRIIQCSHRRQLVKHDLDFRRILRDQGPYDIVHSHLHHYSGYLLRLARQFGIPVRIAHSHSDTSRVDEEANIPRKMYTKLMKRWIIGNATAGFAVSSEAADALFGTGWEADPRWQLLYPSIVPERFQDATDPVSVRAELGIPADAFVVGHVGRFFEPKNHTFLVDIASEVAKREPKMCLLLVGDGLLRLVIKEKVVEAGIADQVIFAGLRSDPEHLMLGAMDVFVLPSLWEGLPLVGIEAQAAGLPFILSDVVSKEMDVVRPLIQRLSLSQPASVWAEAILAVRNTVPPIPQREALKLMEKSHFNINYSVRELESVYAG